MGKAAGFIRLMLAGVFLVALALSVLPASANACPQAQPMPGMARLSGHVASFGIVAATTPIAAALDAPHHGHRGSSTPDCCDLGLCGPAAAVLPAMALVAPPSGSMPHFTSRRAAPIPGLDTSPIPPPPRSRA
ncbi:MAG TPA: hypothetical protein VJ779_00685 [Acetobacteraceae bacterium]|nr:hypothetical protein [Acetobacteraceae bacterium]